MTNRHGASRTRWVPYDLGQLLRLYESTWEAHCHERDWLSKSNPGMSPGLLYRRNSKTREMETQRSLLEAALKATGPIAFKDRIVDSWNSLHDEPRAAPDGTRDAEGLRVEIADPLDGRARLTPKRR